MCHLDFVGPVVIILCYLVYQSSNLVSAYCVFALIIDHASLLMEKNVLNE